MTAEGTAVMNAHLAACPSCVAYLRTYEATIRMGRLALARAVLAARGDA